jgi:uncharacterized protein YbaP (TraB family)
MSIFKTTIALLSLLCFSNGISAQTSASRFDLTTRSLTVPCLVLVTDASLEGNSSDNIAYSLALLFDGQFFQQSSLSQIQRAENCSASFNTSTNVLSDSVRVGDDVYELVLALESGNSFSIVSAGFLRRADTSLWRVSNGINEVFIGGTIHVLKESDRPLPAVFEEAFSLAQILVTEISYDDTENVAANSTLPIRTDGRTLSDTLSSSTYQLLSAHLQSIGTSIRLLEIVEPAWLAQLLINTEIYRAGYSSGVDEHFMEMAQGLGKTNIGLETADFQVAAIVGASAGISDDDIILQALSDVGSGALGPAIDMLVRAWREGDVEIINREVIEPSKASIMAGHKIVFTDRNAAWIPQIEAFLSTPDLELVLVGVGHLVGSDSVLKMLRDLGYSVNRY